MKYFNQWKLWPFIDRVATVIVGAFLFCVSKQLDAGMTLGAIDWGRCIREAVAAGLPLGATWDFLKFRDYKMGA